MIKYFCDRCKREMIDLDAEMDRVGYQPEGETPSWWEVCPHCYEVVMSVLAKLLKPE